MSGLLGPDPFYAGILIIIFLSIGFAKVTQYPNRNKVLAVVWGLYLILLYSTYSPATKIISAIVQIPLMYYYLIIAELLEDKIFSHILFFIFGAFFLAILYSLTYSIIAYF